MIKIENNVPIPDKGNSKYPWLEMEVGDSFFVENPPKQKNGYPSTMATTATRRLSPKKFVQRVVDNGLRVWRIK